MRTGICILTCFFLFAACKKKDTTDPVLQLKGSSSVSIALNGIYNEPGATANDDFDGDISSTISIDSSGLNRNQTGYYTLVYSVHDKAGNSTQAERQVVVKNEALYLQGNYSVVMQKNGTWNYADILSVSGTKNMRMSLERFANYAHANVYFDVSGNTLVLPTQTVVCGNPYSPITFSGTGTINGDVITISFSQDSSGTVLNGTSTYTKN